MSEAVIGGVLLEKVFLEIRQNSQEITYAIVSFSIRLATLLKKRLCHRCFSVNFVKFLRTSFLQNTSRWLLLQCAKIRFWDQFFKKTNLLGKAQKPLLFCSPFFWKKKYWLQFLTSSLNWCQLVNWLYILCKVIRKKKSAVNKWVTLMIGKIIRKSIKKFITWLFGKRSCVTKSSKQGGCYYWKFSTEIAISEFFEKLCHLIIDQKVKY